MAVVGITLSKVKGTSQDGAALLVVASHPDHVEAMVSSASSQASTIAADQARGDQIWQITVSGNDVWVKFGANPVADSGEDHLICDGQTREFVAEDGDKLAVIDA